MNDICFRKYLHYFNFPKFKKRNSLNDIGLDIFNMHYESQSTNRKIKLYQKAILKTLLTTIILKISCSKQSLNIYLLF